MDLQTCRLFAEYNRHANNEMNLLIRKLDKPRWEKEFGGYFKSIREVCNHLYLADFNWMKRFGGLRTFLYLEDPLFDRDLPFSANPIAEIPEYLLKREELDNKLILFAKELRQDDLEKMLSYSDSRGEPHTRNSGGLVFHIFNHQTHHRGMISVYLDAMNIKNDFSNVVPIV